jgi:phosphatidylinositol alpha-1,6-mannosyltransferase
VIPPGVDLPAAPSAVEPDARPTILTVARLVESYKGHDVMIRALRQVRETVADARWVVLGDGPLRPSLEAQAREQGVGDAILFAGSVSDAERDAWYERARVFAMPSRLPAEGLGGEGFGIVYLEAAAHGLPSIGGDVAGARDAILDGETGRLVDPTDPAAVAAAIVELLADSGRAARMGVAARQFAERHSWPRIAARVEVVLEEVAPAATRAGR